MSEKLNIDGIIEVLTDADFKCIHNQNGKQDYKHPKHKHYMITFDRGTLMVFKYNTRVFETRDVTLGIIDGIIHKIKYPKHSSQIFKK